jgi:hypothetical protein
MLAPFDEHDALWGPALIYPPPMLSLSDRWDLQVLIDEEDLDWARQWNWGHNTGSGKSSRLHLGKVSHHKIYAKRCWRPEGKSAGIQITVYLHVAICERAYGPRPSATHLADHLNGDGLDCRRSNLRWATPSQNRRNIYGSVLHEERTLL